MTRTDGAYAPRARPDAIVWAGRAAGGAAAFAAGAALGSLADPLGPALLLLLAPAAVAGALRWPRWSLVVTLFLLVGYVPDVLADDAFPLVTQALTGIVLAAALVRRAYGAESFAIPRELGVLVALALAFLVSSAFADDRAAAAAESLDVIGYAALLVLLVLLLDTAEWLRRAVWATVAAAGALAGLAIIQQVTGAYDADFGGFATVVPAGDAMRSAGPLSPNFLGQLLAAAAVLAFYLSRGAGPRGPAAAAAVACLAGVLCTQSRGALIALLVAAVLSGLLGRIRLGVLAAALCAALVAGALVLPDGFKERIGALSGVATADVTIASEGALRGRTGENLAALEMWTDRPLVGVGPDNFEVHYQAYAQGIGLDPRGEDRAAHNLYLESLAETGLLGAAPFFVLLAMAVAAVWRARRRLAGDDALLADAVLVALVAFLTASVTLHSAYARYLWIFLGLALAAGRLRAREPAS